jgi:HSP20 family protein
MMARFTVFGGRMSSDDDFPDWFKKKRLPYFGHGLFDDVDKMFSEMEKMMKEELKAFTTKVPKEYVKERKLPDGSTVRELGPFVYGYSMKIGPDGKPEIREFGNVKQGRLGPLVKEEREPLVDVMETNDAVHVIAELPGVEKTDIKLHATEDALTILVDTAQQKYYKEVRLPSKVNVKTATTSYKNGVLEIILKKVNGKPKGEPISIS